MNERINKLAEQCTTQYQDGNGGYTDQVDTEKFAELILQECIKVARDQRDPANLNYSEQFVEALRIHFRFWG